MEGVFLLAFLSCCAFWDLRTGRVPNRFILLGAAAFAATVFIRGPSPECGREEVLEVLALSLLRMLFSSVILFPLFLFRMMGAGDIKVMAVITGYLGLSRGFEIIFYGLAAAAVWSLFYMLNKHILVKRIKYFLNYMKKIIQTEQIVPYYCIGEKSEAGFCLVPFLLCGFCLWLAVNGGAV